MEQEPSTRAWGGAGRAAAGETGERLWVRLLPLSLSPTRAASWHQPPATVQASSPPHQLNACHGTGKHAEPLAAVALDSAAADAQPLRHGKTSGLKTTGGRRVGGWVVVVGWVGKGGVGGWVCGGGAGGRCAIAQTQLFLCSLLLLTQTGCGPAECPPAAPLAPGSPAPAQRGTRRAPRRGKSQAQFPSPVVDKAKRYQRRSASVVRNSSVLGENVRSLRSACTLAARRQPLDVPPARPPASMPTTPAHAACSTLQRAEAIEPLPGYPRLVLCSRLLGSPQTRARGPALPAPRQSAGRPAPARRAWLVGTRSCSVVELGGGGGEKQAGVGKANHGAQSVTPLRCTHAPIIP